MSQSDKRFMASQSEALIASQSEALIERISKMIKGEGLIEEMKPYIRATGVLSLPHYNWRDKVGEETLRKYGLKYNQNCLTFL